MNIDELLREYQVRSIKFLKIDTEGHDCIILDGLFDYLKTSPKTEYGKTKIKILKKISNFCKRNYTRFVWLRLFTGYGPGSDKNWLITSTIHKLINNKKTKFTTGHQIYNFIYISDIVSAIIKSLYTNASHGIFNLGHEKSYTIKHVVKLIFTKLKIKKKPVFGELRYREDQIMKFVPSISKMKKKLKWKPAYSISNGISETINFIIKKK
jgi:nucleoside-diphosphate-sugar epimerase